MKLKAIQNLAQLTELELFKQLAEGMKLCYKNAKSILAEAECLAGQRRSRGAKILRQAANEEASKVLVLLDAVRCPQSKPELFSRQLKYFNDHLAKGIYVEVSQWRPANFSEVEKGVNNERKEFYLDGPYDVDWIFYNNILRRREEAIYVNYVENDGSHTWDDPVASAKPDSVDLNCKSQIVKVVRALSKTGFFTANAITEIAAHWRPIEIYPTMTWNKLRCLNSAMLKKLNERGLLAKAHDRHYGIITNELPFPMYPLDLRKERVEKASLQKIRDEWQPYLA